MFPHKKPVAEMHSCDVAIVDDDPAVVDSFKFLLELAGCTVDTYASAVEFLEDCAAHPACLVLDQHMPGMTGLELATQLRASGIAVPILLVTGAPSPAILARANELGIQVLEKPPIEGDLLNFVGAYTQI